MLISDSGERIILRTLVHMIISVTFKKLKFKQELRKSCDARICSVCVLCDEMSVSLCLC